MKSNNDKAKQNHKIAQQMVRQINREENSFKKYINNLCNNNQQQMNPEQQYTNSSQFKINKFSDSHNNISLQRSKLKSLILQKVKNQEDLPPVNFRHYQSQQFQINQKNNYQLLRDSYLRSNVISIGKTNRFQRKQSQNQNEDRYKSNKNSEIKFKIRNSKHSLEKIEKKQNSSPLNYKTSRSHIFSQNKKSNNLSMIHTSRVSWNPQKMQFHEKSLLREELLNDHSSAFLIQILKLNLNEAVTFLQKSSISNFDFENQFNGKEFLQLCSNFLGEMKIKKLRNPLIKKYNNCVYYGERLNIQSHHAGLIFYSNGNLYAGQLKNFQKHGQGIEFSLNLNESKNISFLNLTELNPQSYRIFIGSFYKNTKSGVFRVVSSQFIYHGQLIKGFFHGNGKLILLDGSEFEGEWDMNAKVRGRQWIKQQDIIYEGQYNKQSKYHGVGKLKSNKQLYQGQFKNGQKYGKGIIATEQYIYQGDFINNKKSGKGIYLDKNIEELEKQILPQNLKRQEKIFKVEYQNDYLIFKEEFNEQKKTKILYETLESLKEESQMSVSQQQINKPSGILYNNKGNQIFPKFKISNDDEQQKKIQKMITFNFTPNEPEQQWIGGITNKVSYLQGNRRHLSGFRNHNYRHKY